MLDLPKNKSAASLLIYMPQQCPRSYRTESMSLRSYLHFFDMYKTTYARNYLQMFALTNVKFYIPPNKYLQAVT